MMRISKASLACLLLTFMLAPKFNAQQSVGHLCAEGPMTYLNHLPPGSNNIQTPGGFFNKISDRYGNSYSYEELQINTTEPGGYRYAPPSTTCQAGYFKVYFAVGSGMEQNNPIHNQRRAVVCQVLSDVSGMVNPSFAAAAALPTATAFVNILIDNLGNLVANPSSVGAPLGAASPYCVYPNNPASPNPGIVDNLVYKTIITQQDGYTATGSPFAGGGSGGFYHGSMAFNFVNPAYIINANSSILCPPGQIDLYSVVLHEITHQLGFATLISQTGVSVLGAANNYYGRYDTYLQTSGGTPLLSTTGACVPSYGLAFSAPVGAIGTAGCTSPLPNTTNCGTAIKYVSPPVLPNMPVYTPSCYESGSSLSHFEDMCYPVPNPANNDQYFTMCNAGSFGATKRFLQEEEKHVLCDLGYTTTNSYTSTAAGAPKTYTGSCTPPDVWGINDGIVGGNYIHSSTGGPVFINIATGANAIIANDNTVTVTGAICIESVYNNGVVSVAGNVITFTPNAGVFGPFLLRYIPVDAFGNQGNITYIFGFIYGGNCGPATPCNLIPNGGFENGTSCGSILNVAAAPFNPPGPKCWWQNSGTPDYFVRNCGASGGFYNLGFNTASTIPILDSHNGSPNNSIVGLIGSSGISISSQSSFGTESIWTSLTSSLVPGQAYTLGFWAYNYVGPISIGVPQTVNQNFTPLVISFATSNVPPVGIGLQYPLPPMQTIVSVTLNPSTSPVNNWQLYTTTFTYTGTTANQFFAMGVDFLKTHSAIVTSPGVNLSAPYQVYAFVDDISLVSASLTANFNPPTPICTGGSLMDLSQYLTPPVPGGVYTGTGVTIGSTSFDFNAVPTLTAGNYPIMFSYTNSAGCPMNASAIITLTNTPAPFTFTLPPSICQLTGISDLSVSINPTVYATGGDFLGTGVYQFSPGPPPGYGLAINNVITPGVYTYTYAYPNYVLTNTAVIGGTLNCLASTTATTQVIPPITTTVVPNKICLLPGQTSTLIASSNYTNVTYTWTPGGATTSSLVINPTVTTVYNYTVSNGVCSTVNSVTATVIPLPQFTNTPAQWCTYQSVFYLENFLAPGTPTGGVWNIPNLGTISTPTPGYTQVNINPVLTTLGIHNVFYTYTDPISGCSATDFFTVNIVPGFTIATNGLSTYCQNIPGASAVISATANPGAGVTYTWFPGSLVGQTQNVSPPSQTVYSVVATAPNGCQSDNTQIVNISTVCCTGNNYFTTNTIGSGNFNGGWAINQDITITGNVSFGGEFKIAPNVSITVASGAFLDVSGAHLYACGDMWYGIVVPNGGKLRVAKESLVEDAITAITSVSCTNSGSSTIFDLDITSTTFNRNYISILIKGYNQSTNAVPFHINGCLFTCRTIPFSAASWPATSATIPGSMLYTTGCFPTALGTPFCLNYYPAVSNLKVPYTTLPSHVGVMVENSGLTSNPTATNPVYFSVIVGHQISATSPNVFDNLLHGIYAKNSNVISKFNVFQNTQRLFVASLKKTYIGGIGIYGVNDNTHSNTTNYISNVMPSGNAFASDFYDCHFGVKVDNIFQINFQGCTFKSNQSSAIPTQAMTPGQYGIYIFSNRLKNYRVSNNAFYNNRTAIYIAANPGPLSIPSGGINTYGSYYGFIQINQNLFTRVPFGPTGNAYIGHGVFAAGFLSGISGIAEFYEPGAQLRIYDNNFKDVYRGIQVSNFSNKNFPAVSTTNTVTLIQDANPLNEQFGIAHINKNLGSIVNTNTVIGVSVYNNTFARAIKLSLNDFGNSVVCNSVTNVYSGFLYEGSNAGTIWRRNKMRTMRRGLHMVSGVIGQQGSFGNPSDNEWQAGWGGNNGTWTDGNTFPVSSPLYIRSGGVYTPPFNANGAIPPAFPQTYVIGANTVFFTNGPFQPCPGGGGGCTTCNPGLIANLDDIANDNITYTVNVAETKEINKDLVFRGINQEPSLATMSSTLGTFFANNLPLTRGLYSSIESNLAQGNFPMAGSLLAAFSPTTTIEQNNKTFYELYKSWLGNGFLTNQEKITLLILSYQCPLTDGPVVYDARNLFGLVNETVIVYNDTYCSQLGFSFRSTDSTSTTEDRELEQLLVVHEKASKKKFEQYSVYDLYPNPATNIITIEGNQASEAIQMTITDVNGRVLMAKTLKVLNYKTQVNLDLINGIYFVNLISESGYKTTKKLVIAK